MRPWLLLAALTSILAASTSQAQPSHPEEVPPEPPPDDRSTTTTTSSDIQRLSDENAQLRARVERLEGAIAPPSVPATLGAPEPPVLQPTILGEADYRLYPSETEGNTGFAIGRFRPGLILSPARWFRAVATAEFAGEHAAILDAFVRLRASDWAEFTIGYSKPPMFASFIYEPVHTLPFPDQSAVVTSFRVDRDVGADVHFTPHSVPLEGWVRVGNGTGSPLGNDNALPAGYASLDLVLGRAWVGSEPVDRTYGLRLGGGAFVESPRDRDGIVGRTPLGFVYFRPVVVSGLRVVGEAHVVGYAGPLRLTVEGAIARESRSRDDDGNPATPRVDLPAVRSYGVAAELAWVIHGMPREVGRAPRGMPREHGAWSGGAVELAARYDGMWLGRDARDVRPGGSQNGEFAVKWWPVDFMAAALAGYVTRYDAAPIEEPGTLWSYGGLLRVSFFWGTPSEPQRTAREVIR